MDSDSSNRVDTRDHAFVGSQATELRKDAENQDVENANREESSDVGSLATSTENTAPNRAEQVVGSLATTRVEKCNICSKKETSL